MQPPVPGFPRRGVPIHKLSVPRRRDPPQHFLRTSIGRRFVLLVICFVALIGTTISSYGGRPARPAAQIGADSRPAAVALTTPPRVFAAAEVLHQLRTITDFSRSPHPGAINAAIEYLAATVGPESRPAVIDWTDLAVAESIAHPEQFRGGLVRVRGAFMGVETFGPHTAIKAEYTYRGYLLCPVGRDQALVTFESAAMPSEFERNDALEIDGVFLQIAEYEDKKGIARPSPFLVTTAARRHVVTRPETFFEHRFYLIFVVLIILTLLTTFFLFRKSRLPAPPTRHVVRPPGPGR